MSHETMVLIAKVVGPLWMGGFLIVVLIRSYNPARRTEQERIARSILEPGPARDLRKDRP